MIILEKLTEYITELMNSDLEVPLEHAVIGLVGNVFNGKDHVSKAQLLAEIEDRIAKVKKHKASKTKEDAA